ncbi:hypothetical protein GW17_00020301 [Ensete ventricosum]|nr:hypothetical protein GW17_00020301 [Ensete ventricosum]
MLMVVVHRGKDAAICVFGRTCLRQHRVCVHISSVSDAADDQSVEQRRQPHQVVATRGGSRVRQRPRKWQPRMPPTAACGGSRVQERPRKRRPRAPTIGGRTGRR